MNAVEAGLVMRRIAAGLGGVEVDPEAVEVWADLMSGVPADVAGDAADAYLSEAQNRYFPTVAIFQQYVGKVHRERTIAAREAHREAVAAGAAAPCGVCDNGWVEADPTEAVNLETGEVIRYEAWRPCRTCNPTAWDAWQRYRDEAKREAAARAEKSGVAVVADLLADAKAGLG